jgi:endonuclease YncB( thermonuclease family)
MAAPIVTAAPLRHGRQAECGASRHREFYQRHVVAPDTIRVLDGDTFSVPGRTVRLRSIDTPEHGAPHADAATARLRQLLAAGPVTIVPRTEDVYCRTIADVYVSGTNVAHILRREGFAKRRR